MELLVVVSIMVILAGLSLGILGYVNNKDALERAKIQLGLLETALESYKSENGEYPQSTRPDGTGGTNEMFQKLFPKNEDEKVYLPQLDPENDPIGWLSSSGRTANYATMEILDPWANEFRYRSAPNTGRGGPVSANPGYDLWSSGPDGKSTASRGDYDPKHPDNLDDIRLW